MTEHILEENIVRSALAGSFKLVQMKVYHELLEETYFYYKIITPVAALPSGRDIDEANELFDSCVKSAY